MRDPARIDKVLKILRAYWRMHPDLRLGQIVVHVAQYVRPTRIDPFYLEDNALLVGIRDLIERDRRSGK